LRCIATCDATGNVTFFTRNGNELPSVQHLASAVADLLPMVGYPFVLDGEMLSGPTFLSSVSDLRSHKAAKDAVYHVFDILPLDIFLSRGVSLAFRQRYQLLGTLLVGLDDWPIKLVKHWEVKHANTVQDYFKLWRSQGLEGAIVKDPEAAYPFKRAAAWQKIKDFETHDLKVVGVKEGTGKSRGKLGSLIVSYHGKQVEVGTGFSDAQRGAFWITQPIGKVIEVSAHETTEHGSLRHPRFERLRTDLNPEDYQ
jgi:DNA ligase-1